MSIRNVPKNKLNEVIKESEHYTDVLRKLGYHTKGRSYHTLKKIIVEYGISTSHFKLYKVPTNQILDSEFFSKGHERKGVRLKDRLIKGGLEEKCHICGIGPEWSGQPLSLQIDHIDGDRENNEKTNLRLLCPNCHSQTSTWGGKRFKKDDIKCKTCDKILSSDNKSGLCRQCYSKSEHNRSGRKFDPNKDELEKLVEENPIRSVGKIYGVSDNAIRKRCDRLGISWRKRCPVV